jgi:hypothetical protein
MQSVRLLYAKATSCDSGMHSLARIIELEAMNVLQCTCFLVSILMIGFMSKIVHWSRTERTDWAPTQHHPLITSTPRGDQDHSLL